MSRGLYIGIDVGVDRGCAFTGVDQDANMVESGWFHDEPPAGLTGLLKNAALTGRRVLVGIDAPRCPVPSPRPYYWDGTRRSWRERRKERGAGRHCEVVLKAHGLGNPHWTPLASDEIPPWMECGFRIFQMLSGLEGVETHEVYPTASYILLEGQSSPRATVDFSEFRRGPRDMLDACVAATTVRELDRGRGTKVGGGDGLGAITLPRMLPAPVPEVLEWPEASITAA